MNVVEGKQRSDAWFTARRGLPTASRFDRILTAVRGEPSKAQNELINDLLAESLCPPQEGLIRGSYISPEMEEGMKLEGEARSSYELEYATEPVIEVGFVLDESGMFGGSPDALVGEVGGAEIKCPNASTHIGYFRAGVLPNEYKAQVHGYMIVTRRDWWDFFTYHRGIPPFRLRILRDEFTAKLAAEVLAFCEKYNKARAMFDLPPLGSVAPHTIAEDRLFAEACAT